MDLSYVQKNIDIIPTVVFVTDENLNLLSKNNYSRLSVTRTRIGASLAHYVNQSDLHKIKELNNKDGILVDFVRNSVVSFIVLRHDCDKTYYVLFDAHLHHFIERRIYGANQSPTNDLIKHFNIITESIFTQCNNSNLTEPDRLISRKLKINNYLRHITSITKFQDPNTSASVHNVIYELNTVIQMFDLLAKSVGMTFNIDIGEHEAYVKCNKGDIYFSVFVVLYFAMITAVDKTINISFFKFEKSNYIVVDYSTCLPESIVSRLIIDKHALDEISDNGQYEVFYLLKLAKAFLKKLYGEMTITLPGGSLSNIRILLKLFDDDNTSNNFHESNWLENQIIELYNKFTQNYNERFEDSEDE